MPRTGLSSQELVEKALGIAMALIRQHGVEKFRLSDIARALRVSHAALYNHFPDKAALLDAISEGWLHEMDAELARAAQIDLPPCEAIEAWFLTFHALKREKVLKDPELFKTFNLAVESSKPFVLLHLKNLRELLLTLVLKAQTAGELRAAPAEELVETLFEATHAFHHPRMVLELKEERREELLRRIVSTLLKGAS